MLPGAELCSAELGVAEARPGWTGPEDGGGISVASPSAARKVPFLSQGWLWGPCPFPQASGQKGDQSTPCSSLWVEQAPSFYPTLPRFL